MSRERRWDPCIAHRDGEVTEFVSEYFGRRDRKTLLVAGAGFDPRARTVPLQLNDAKARMRTLLIKEHRPDPVPWQTNRAAANTKALLRVLGDVHVEAIDVFGSDGAVVGGRRVVNALRQECVGNYTDIVVDISALSVGISFPIVGYFFESACQSEKSVNVHVFVTHNPVLDADIRSIPTDVPGYVHGFKGGSTLFANADAARLWLPQLGRGRRGTLERLYDFVAPHETCPILPFPASDPRRGDDLAEEYLTELEDTWEVDTRNIVYADEGDPLDLYRTILGLDDRRQPVFAETGDSMLVLSPLGSKVMALGALMAALERGLPIAHVESLAYDVGTAAPATRDGYELIHIWLTGDAYPTYGTTSYSEGGRAQ